ncbi:helicase associated domain-containing protein [Paenibacillus sp. NRS-1775]|uniref:helicase associated domain-containing protein n=1 Tax=unclassified Paenibacillus TaxID=185978 RepID=UPI003D26C9D7
MTYFEEGLSWNIFYELLIKFKKENGHTNVPQNYKLGDINLGIWISCQRQRKNKLSQERIDRLNKINFVWEPNEKKWNDNFNLLLKYKVQNGHCDVPQNFIMDKKNLGKWVSIQRTFYRNNKLSTRRIEKLSEINFEWKISNEECWNKKFSLLLKYK